MKVLVVGGGGREHALCWKIAQSPLLSELLCAPGNAGTRECAHNVDVAADDVPGIVRLAKAEGCDLVVVGPEDPLCAGIADALRKYEFRVRFTRIQVKQIEGQHIELDIEGYYVGDNKTFKLEQFKI